MDRPRVKLADGGRRIRLTSLLLVPFLMTFTSVSGAIEATRTVAPTGATPGAAEAEGSSNSAAIPPGLAVELDQLIPEAENGTTSQVTVLMGETVLLPCKAYSLGQRTVSWVRRRDWHILSSGSHVYTADGRFHVLHRPGSPDWVLMLKSPQLHDSGIYECQISGGRGQVSHYVELLVWAPVAVISEGNEHHVEAGSNVQLHCSLRQERPADLSSSINIDDASLKDMSQTPMAPGGSSPVVWFHNGRPLSNEGKSAGGGQVQVQVEGDKTKWTAWTSRLRVSSAESADSGNYSCVPWRGKVGSVSVFVSQGDRPAAVQRQAANPSAMPIQSLIIGLNLLLCAPFIRR